MQRQPVESSNVASIGYDYESQVLEVQFKSGATYQYKGVQAKKYVELLSADSIGSFINKHIVKAGHEYEEVKEDEDNAS